MYKKIIIIILSTILLVISGCTGKQNGDNILIVDVDDVLCGSYQDITSQRASCTISKDNDIYYITVVWPTSANETTTWTMSATKDGDRLNYNGETFSTRTYDKDGKELVGDGASNNIGYFEIKDSKLYWTMANDERNRSCIFEKIQGE